MAVFSMDKNLEVIEEFSSETIDRVRLLAEPGTFKARSIKYRHPRFKNRFSNPNFMVSFRLDGKMQSLCESTIEDLDIELKRSYLNF